ncbi:MAG: OsmC family protein [Balneolaceae bacterium]|nr:OsmC family protein [Balneolaceae bacterium]
MKDQHSYTVDLNWREDRRGTLSSPELNDRIEVATPPEFEGGEPGIWSPEHLFVASVSSCLMTTFLAMAGYARLSYSHLEVHARGTLDKTEEGYMMTEITLYPALTIERERDRDKAVRLLEKAEKNCLISRSVKTRIRLECEVTVSDPVW